MSHQRLAEFGDADDHVGGGHEFADQEEEGNCHQGFGIDAVEQLADDGLEGDGGERRSDQHAGDQAERHWHAQIAERQEQHGHQAKNQRVSRDHQIALSGS